jgi:sigma-B regulation protein RsbU (phosphoserine phosphatase)
MQGVDLLTGQPQSADWVGWRQLLEFGEQLMAAPAVAAQINLILETVAHLLRGQGDLWLADVFYRLPCFEELPSFSAVPTSELMRSAVETRRVYPSDAADAEAGPLSVAVPLLVNDVLMGAVQVERPEGPAFSHSEIQILTGLAVQSAIALHATLQVEVERWRVEQLSLVRMVSGQVANVLDLDELFHRVADLILDTFRYYYVALFTLEPGHKALRFRASSKANGQKHSQAELQVRLGEGIIGHVAQTGEEILANDVSREPRYCHEDALPETSSEAALPLMIENRILGVLDVQSDQPDDFDETDMLVLRALAHNISIAIEDARIYGDLQRRADQLAAVGEVSRAVASILDLDLLLEEVVTLIQRRFGYPFVHLFTVQPGRQQVVYQAGSGSRSQALRTQGLTYYLDDAEGIIPWVARHGETVLANDVKRDPRYRPSELPPTNACAELAVPLIFGGEVLGVLDVQSDRRRAFADEDAVLLEALADNVAIAIRNANLYRSEHWRRQVADSLREVAGLLSADIALDQVLNAILTELERTLACDAAAIWLLENGATSSSETHMQLAAIYGCTSEETAHVKDLLPETNSWLEHVINAAQPVIRDPRSSAEPLGVALGFSPDYSAIAAPLRVGEQPLGLLTLVHHTSGRYGAESEAMTAAFASYAAVAIENTRLYEAAQEQAWMSTVLLQVAEATQSLTTLDEVLESVVRLLPMLVGVERCALFVSSKERGSWGEAAEAFVPAVAYGFSPSQKVFFDEWYIARGDVLAFDHLCLIKSPIVIPDAAHDPRLPEDAALALGFESLLLLPLLAHGEVLGAMLVDFPGDWSEFEEDRVAMLQGIAHQTAAAIENAQLLEARQEEAYVSVALLQVAQAVASFNDLDDILEVIVRITPMLVGVEWCVIFLWEDAQASFRPVRAYGMSRSARAVLLAQRYASGDFPLLDAVRESQNMLALDGFSDWGDLIPSSLADDFVVWLRSTTGPRTARQVERKTHSVLALPLSVRGGVLGVMLVEEASPVGPLREKRVEIIAGIAQQAALAVQNDLLQQEMAEREQLERELQLAREIQQTFMPHQTPHLHGWELAFTWEAARQVAGDFYDFFELPGGRWGLVIADVADKGVPAALFMALTRAILRATALEDESPAAVLARANDLLVPDAQHGMFVTVIYAVLSLETGQLVYAVAGHNLPLLWRFRSQELEQFDRGGMALGVLEGVDLEDRVVSLEPGDQVIFYTDGITEAFSPEAGDYGEERLWMTIRTSGNDTAQALLKAIGDSLADFVGDSPPSDDITLMVLRRQAS